MAKKREIIVIPVASVLELADAHHITRQAVYNALGYRSNSMTAQAIRKQAMELYGGVVSHKVYF